MSEVKKYESRDGHRSSVYTKQELFPKLRKLIALTEYFRGKGIKSKQSLSYWYSVLLSEHADELFERVQAEENVTLTWKDKTLVVVGKPSAEDSLIDKVMKEEEKRQEQEE